MDIESPFFSILIPSYNRPESIVECVESVLANRDEEFEIIISDDASPKSDAIDQALQPYLDRPNIQFHRQATNLGEPANRNALVARARGRYNIILCDDDKLFSHALRTIRKHIEATPEHDLYLFGYQVVDATGRACYDRAAPGPLAILLEHSQLVRRLFEARWLPFLICHPSTFCCRRGVEMQIPYRADVSTADDYMFLLECVNGGKRLHILPECLMQYRWVPSPDGARQTNQSSDNVKVLQAYAKVYYALQQADLHPTVGNFIRGSNYRQRFLYDVIIRRVPSVPSCMDLLGLLPTHQEELTRYAATQSRRSVLWTTAMNVVWGLTQVFGVRGFLYSVQAGVAFLRSRVLTA